MSSTFKRQTPLVVRVTVTDDLGSTYTRGYVRGQRRISAADFASWALGDLMRMVFEYGKGLDTFTVVNVTDSEDPIQI